MQNFPAIRHLLTLAICFFVLATFYAQPVNNFTADDTLRGAITPERKWWDLKFYKLEVALDISKKKLWGSNKIHYQVLAPAKMLQIDLQDPMILEKAEQDGERLNIIRKGPNAYWIELKKPQTMGAMESVVIQYSGIPRVARNAPWDGGISWSKDKSGQPFVATSCQGLGASVWWPCKDHPYDEPDSQLIAVRVPKPLMDVSNGRLRKVIDHGDGTRTFEWFVANPINNYGVNLNIANYASFSDTLHGEKGVLSLDYFVLQENLDKAKTHFQQVKGMLRAFEYWFGPYPFYEDGYKLVEAPYLGMEHQSSVTYGNQYRNGYLGMDLSRTGWGKKWDYIIVHESGHEWFANNITYRDPAEMWIHESFTMYSEGLYTEYHFGKEAGAEYMRGLRRDINNDRPIIGIYGVNNEGSGDMYHKGGNMLHTIRQVVDNDSLWRTILRDMNRKFYHQTVDGAQIENFISEQSGKNLKPVFDQYLRDIRIPNLEYERKKGKFRYRWTNCVEGFNMPVKVKIGNGQYEWWYPDTTWKTSAKKIKKGTGVTVHPDFYVGTN